MTPERQQIVIAESRGWKPYSPGDFNPTPRWINAVNRVCKFEELPDYLNSRDAMADALAGLTKYQRATFLATLANICGYGTVDPTQEEYTDLVFDCVVATPSQLAEAYLRTKGLWEE